MSNEASSCWVRNRDEIQAVAPMGLIVGVVLCAGGAVTGLGACGLFGKTSAGPAIGVCAAGFGVLGTGFIATSGVAIAKTREPRVQMTEESPLVQIQAESQPGCFSTLGSNVMNFFRNRCGSGERDVELQTRSIQRP